MGDVKILPDPAYLGSTLQAIHIFDSRIENYEYTWYWYDEDGNSIPNTGYIVWDEEHQQAYFQSTMNVYLDAPGLAPKVIGIEMGTNMHSLPLTLNLYGPVSFLPDGRMEITLTNTQMVDIDVAIDTPFSPSKVYLKIPKESVFSTRSSQLDKRMKEIKINIIFKEI